MTNTLFPRASVESVELSLDFKHQVLQLSRFDAVSPRCYRCEPGFSRDLSMVYIGDLCYDLSNADVKVEPVRLPYPLSLGAGDMAFYDRNHMWPSRCRRLQPAFSACNRFLALCGSMMPDQPPEADTLELYRLDLVKRTAELEVLPPSIRVDKASWIRLAFHPFLPLLAIALWFQSPAEDADMVDVTLRCYILSFNGRIRQHLLSPSPTKSFDGRLAQITYGKELN